MPQHRDYCAPARLRPRSCTRSQKRLDGGSHYETVDAFADDIALVWANCRTYNKDPSADVCVMGECTVATHAPN